MADDLDFMMGSQGLNFRSTPAGPRAVVEDEGPIPAIILGGYHPYSWQEVLPCSGGQWTPQPKPTGLSGSAGLPLWFLLTAGNPFLLYPSSDPIAAGIKPGMAASGPGLPPNTLVFDVQPDMIELDAPALFNLSWSQVNFAAANPAWARNASKDVPPGTFVLLWRHWLDVGNSASMSWVFDFFRRQLIVSRRPKCVRTVAYKKVRRGGAGASPVQSWYGRLRADQTMVTSATGTLRYDTTVPVTTPNYQFPYGGDDTKTRYTGSNPNLVLATLAIRPDPTLPAGTSQQVTVNLNVNGSAQDTQVVGLCADVVLVELYLDQTLAPATNDIVTVTVVNDDPTYIVTVLQTSGTQLTFFDFPGGLTQQHSP